MLSASELFAADQAPCFPDFSCDTLIGFVPPIADVVMETVRATKTFITKPTSKFAAIISKLLLQERILDLEGSYLPW